MAGGVVVDDRLNRVRGVWLLIVIVIVCMI